MEQSPQNIIIALMAKKFPAFYETQGLFIWFVRLLALRPILAYCVSLG
jgi:hypothetical protein